MSSTEPTRRRLSLLLGAAIASASLAMPATVCAQDAQPAAAATNTTTTTSAPAETTTTTTALTPAQEAARLANARRVLHLARGDWSWGLGVPLLRLGVLRRADEPGYLRNFEPQLQALTPQITFQVTYKPNTTPWRREDTETGTPTQVIAVSGLIIGGLDSVHSLRSEIAIGLSVDFLDGIVSLGVGVDLYRGVPVRDGAGAAGEDTVPTGLFSWAMTRNGEFTAENVFLILNLGLTAIGGKLQ